MIGEIAFYTVAAFTVVSALLIFLAKSLLRAVATLTLVFVGSALIMLLLGQSFFAMLQLLIFVGGLSTYLMVAVGSETKKIERYSIVLFADLLVATLLFLSIVLVFVPQGVQSGSNMLAYLSVALSQYYLILYLIVIMIFCVSIASILLIKRISKLIV